MANKKISELNQIGAANLTDTDQLVVVDVESSATRRLSVDNLRAHIQQGMSTSADSNLTAFASYANSTFVTTAAVGGNASLVQDNLTLYANTANSSIDVVEGNLTAFATYANTSFSGGAGVVQTNLHHFGTTA